MTVPVDTPFAAMLDAAQLAAASHDFVTALRSALPVLEHAPAQAAARCAHGLVTYAIVFGVAELAEACRAFEAAVADGYGQVAARQRAQREVELTLARLSGSPAGPQMSPPSESA